MMNKQMQRLLLVIAFLIVTIQVVRIALAVRSHHLAAVAPGSPVKPADPTVNSNSNTPISPNSFPFARQRTLLESNAGAFKDPRPTIYLPRNKTEGFSISELQELCHDGKDLSITRFWAISADAGSGFHESLYLDHCYPIEITSEQEQRSMGICADYVMYIYYAHARLSPGFQSETLSNKVGSCPKSTYLHSEHLTKILLSIPNVRNWWMPNIEQITPAQAVYMPSIHKYLCKTQVTCKLLAQYMRTNKINHNSPIDSPLKFMSHSSPDAMKDIQARNMTYHVDYNRFFHSYGSSGRKNTPALIECWKRHPTWPRLTVVGNKEASDFGFNDDSNPVPGNMRIHSRLPIRELRDLQMRNGVHLCPSQMEGYGHYINEARSLGALVVTTDAPPMNEMVMDGVNGILINHDKGNLTDKTFPPKFMYEVYLTADEICSAVERVLEMELESRVFLGREGRVAYDSDMLLMQHNMAIISKETVLHLFQDGWKPDFRAWEQRLRDMDGRIINQFERRKWYQYSE